MLEQVKHLATCLVSQQLSETKPTPNGRSANTMRTLVFCIVKMVWAKYSLFKSLDPLGTATKVWSVRCINHDVEQTLRAISRDGQTSARAEQLPDSGFATLASAMPGHASQPTRGEFETRPHTGWCNMLQAVLRSHVPRPYHVAE